MEGNTELSDFQAVALAHLNMIVQAANGKYRPQPGEIERRALLVMAVIKTGQCIPTDEDKQLLEAMKGLVPVAA